MTDEQKAAKAKEERLKYYLKLKQKQLAAANRQELHEYYRNAGGYTQQHSS